MCLTHQSSLCASVENNIRAAYCENNIRGETQVNILGISSYCNIDHGPFIYMYNKNAFNFVHFLLLKSLT